MDIPSAVVVVLREFSNNGDFELHGGEKECIPRRVPAPTGSEKGEAVGLCQRFAYEVEDVIWQVYCGF